MSPAYRPLRDNAPVMLRTGNHLIAAPRAAHLMLSALVLLLTACAASSNPVADLRAQGVHLSDLPYGATPEPGVLLTSAQAAKRDGVRAGVYAAQGRRDTYVSSFSRTLVDGLAPSGPTRVDSEVAAYRTAIGANRAFHFLMRRLSQGYAMGTPAGGAALGAVATPAPKGSGISTYAYVAQRVPRIGDEDGAFTTYFPGDEFSYRMWLIVFRRGVYVASVRAVGIDSQIPLSTAVSLARRVDRRLERAH